MVTLPSRPEFPTIDAMKKAVEAAQENAPRDYIGGSGIGHECTRKIWYGFKGYPQKPKPFKNIAAIEDGHRTEDLIAARLRMVEGIELHTHKPDGSQYGFDWGFMRGHYDGVIKGVKEAPKTWHIWENKCVNEKKYKALIKAIEDYGQKDALRRWDMLYYGQAVIYMEAEGMPRHFMTASTPGGRDVISVRTNENPKFAQGLKSKAKAIFNATEAPPRMWSKDYYQCKWCDYYNICHEE